MNALTTLITKLKGKRMKRNAKDDPEKVPKLITYYRPIGLKAVLAAVSIKGRGLNEGTQR